MYFKVLIFLIFFIFTGCSKSVTLNKLITPNIDFPISKNITIKKFQNDNISQKESISTLLTNLKVDNKRYFNVVNRADMKDILHEHKLKDVGIVSKGSLNGEILEVSSIITGKVITQNLSTSHFTRQQSDYSQCLVYKKNKCFLYKQQYIRCKRNSYYLTSHILLTSVKNSKVLFEKTYSKNDEITHCNNDNNILQSKKVMMNILAKSIAKEFVKDIAPYYIQVKVDILEDIDISLEKNNEKIFENALKAQEVGAFEEAMKMFELLNKKTHNKSYVIFYNLALSLEGLGKITKAKTYYEKAKKIAVHKGADLEEILRALARLKV